MNIRKIELYNFRCYKYLKIDKFSNLNIIIGSNGIGKTSILESIYLGSLTKTFKSNDDLSVIKSGEDFTKIKIKVFNDFINNNLEFIMTSKGKNTKINDFVQKKLSNYICYYNVMLFSPDEVKIIKSAPSIRRNYFNVEISQIDKEYIKLLNNYNKVVKNKNEFLKKIMLNNNLDYNYLDILDEKLVEIGLKIYNCRKKYINNINMLIQKKFNNFRKKDTLIIDYVSDFNLNNKEKILKLIRKNRNKEINIGMSNIGIHRDDFVFIHNNMNAKDFSSQGILKLIILSMKLSEVEIFNKIYNKKPILLLDDLFSELDKENKNKIFKLLNKESQIFITSTDINNIDKKIINKAKIFDLSERKKYE